MNAMSKAYQKNNEKHQLRNIYVCNRIILRWEDGVEEDVARLGCRNWKIVALNREGWRKLLKEAEAHPGL